VTDPHQILHDRFGFSHFRGVQEQVVARAMAGQHVLAVMPTGAGKSLTYQLPALARPGTGIIISPLIALMHDQVRSAEGFGIRAAALTSLSEDPRAIRDALRDGQLDLLYVAPERASGEGFAQLLQEAEIALFAIDEAHCVSEWGHDFRPDYRLLRPLLDRFRDVPRLALTATADRRTRADILAQLGIPEEGMIIAGFDRPNIRYHVVPRDGIGAQLKTLLGDHSGPGIIYATSRVATEKLAEQLGRTGRATRAYHAGLDGAVRQRNQSAFVASEDMVIAATVAFGMGIDKPDVRFVAHAGAPKSIEAYYQETGRAGRDGDPAEAWLFWGADDFARARRRIETEVEPDRRPGERERLNALAGFVEAATCRRAILLRHFGEEPKRPAAIATIASTRRRRSTSPKSRRNCSPPPSAPKCASASRISPRCSAATTMRRSASSGITICRCSTSCPPTSWRCSARWRARCSPAMRCAATIMAAELRPRRQADPQGRRAPRHRRPAQAHAQGARRRRAAPDFPHDPLFEALRAWRRTRAKEQGVPPYVIFHDSTLREVAAVKPSSLSALSRIEGIGDTKLDRHGESLLEALASAMENDHGASA
jgi:ATP-dependent DNA helicase RecQ